MAGGGTPHLSKSRVIYTSKPELLLYIWCRYSLTRQQLGMIQVDKVRTEGSAERAGITNGKIRCMTIRYIIVRYC